MTEALVESGEETRGVQSGYLEGGYRSHGTEVLEIRSQVPRNEIKAQSDDEPSGVLQDLSSLCQPKVIELGAVKRTGPVSVG